MNSEPIKLNIIDGILDIEPLIEPAFSNLETTLLALFFLLTIAMPSYYIWRTIYSRKGAAKRNINKLLKEFTLGKINKHDIAYQVSNALRNGLKLNHINTNTKLPSSLSQHKNDWDTFTKNLSYLRYSKDIELQIDIRELCVNSIFWLKKWP